MKTKQVYTSKGVLFEDRELAIICTNVKNPIELTVPVNVQAITGKIHIDATTDSFPLEIELRPELHGFDWTEITDYCPDFTVKHDGDFTPVEGVEFGWDDLSETLQERITELLHSVEDYNDRFRSSVEEDINY